MSIEEKNMGLGTNFYLEDGKFKLIGGEDKALDNIVMFLNFGGFFRLFKADFIAPVYVFLQKTSGFIFKYRNIYRLKLMAQAAKFCPYTNIVNVDMPIAYSDRRTFNIEVQYRYKLSKNSTLKKITFIK